MTWLRPPGPVAPGLRVGLLGGSFNPAHDGHLYVSEVALKRLGLDYVWWLVTPQNPLKDGAGLAPLGDRLQQARDIARHPRIVVTDIERALGTRYSIDTLKALQRRFPELDFTWLMGSDNLEIFRRWRRWREIAQRVPIAVVQRPGTVLAALSAQPMQHAAARREICVVDGRRNAQSSTALRAGKAR
ncbi:MAG TPA: nicotinate (nicotinamide) nucleotide adenylyltransferase [Rhizomicrobium sp.]|jgi:nicotinate-nucleotide adenylyltransferase|nr:nicotinate (nicotinamide) nucleotide adenylyltransferase [Rhizomicrobium sp.]